MTLIYTLVITGAPYGTQNASTAYQFAQALLKKGHRINALFFYREGVMNANKFTLPANDEFDLVSAWQTLAMEHDFKLWVCVAAALRRGVISHIEAEAQGWQCYNLMPKFEMVGLGALAESMLTSDRTLQF